MKNKYPIRGKNSLLRWLDATPRSSIADAGASAPLNSTFQASSYVVSKSLLRVWCWAELNSHKLKARCWHGSIRRMSMTWTTLTSVGVLGTGVPRLACLRLTTWLKGAQHGPSPSTQTEDPREGPSL